MITHKLSVTKDPDTSDWVIQLTIKGQPDRQYMTMHPQRAYEPGTDENAWLRCELIRAQMPPRWYWTSDLARDFAEQAMKAQAEEPEPDSMQGPVKCETCQPEPDPNKVPDWVWERWATKRIKIAAFDERGCVVFASYENAVPTVTGGWKGEGEGSWISWIEQKNHGLTVPDWTRSLTKRPKHLGGLE